MHKLMEFLCDEIDDLERKAEKEGTLSMAEVQYLDTLAHTKKNLLKAEEMSDDGYSNRGYSRGDYRFEGDGSYGRQSYARRRDAMGRYSSRGYSMGTEGMVSELRGMMHDAPDEMTKREFQKFITKIESM